VDLVLQPFDGAGVVVVITLTHRDGYVGLLDPPDHFFVQPALQILGRLHHRVGVGVLGLEVGDHLRVLALVVPHPVVRVDDLATLASLEVFDSIGDWGFG